MAHILLAVTAASELTLADGAVHPTGFWAEELVEAHRGLTAAGHTLTIATPGGAPAPVDPGSLVPDMVGGPERAAELRGYLEEIAAELEAPRALADVTLAGVSAVVIPGGHGPMADLATDPALGALLVAAVDAGVVVAPFCHGPAGLLSATRADGTFAFAGVHLTVFSDTEELTGGLGQNAPWFVAQALAERGAVLEHGEPWSPFVVRDGSVISGQNPQSSLAVVAAVAEALASARRVG